MVLFGYEMSTALTEGMSLIFGMMLAGNGVSVTTKRCGSAVISISSTIACLMLMCSSAMIVAICARIPG